MAIVPAAAQAAPSITVTPSMPGSVAIGQTNVAGSVTVTATGTGYQNQVGPAGRFIGICSTAAYAQNEGGCSTIGAPWNHGITLTPSCAQASAPTTSVPLCQTADPNVFTVSSTATGAAGTTCAGVTFDVVVVDAARGTVKFEPRPAGSFVTLGAAGTSCKINFSFNVNQKTPIDADAGAAGIQTRSLATAGGWFYEDDKKKDIPLKAVGQSTTSYTCPPGSPGTPPNCTPVSTPTPTPTPPIETPTPTPTPPVETPTPTPTCTPTPPGVPPNPDCDPIDPPADIVDARASGPNRCTDTRWAIPVTVDADEEDVLAVEFIRGGRVVKTQRTANGGLGTYVLRGSAKALTPGLVKYRVRVRLQNDASFVRGRLVQALTLREVIRFSIARDCRPTTVKLSAACTGSGAASLFRATVTGIRDPRKVARVAFRLNGRKAKTLTRASGGNDWVFRGPIARLGNRAVKFSADVTLRKGSFARNKTVKSKSVGPVTLKRSARCEQGPPPTVGG